MTRWFVNVYGEAEPRSTGWDGSDDYEMPFKSQVFFNAYLGSSNRKVEMDGIEDPHREDHSSSHEDLEISNSRTMSRQEGKQLDREIPWREVDALPILMRDKYVQSAVSE